MKIGDLIRVGFWEPNFLHLRVTLYTFIETLVKRNYIIKINVMLKGNMTPLESRCCNNAPLPVVVENHIV